MSLLVDTRDLSGMAVIHLWRYVENRRNYPGLHLTADAGGRKVLVDHLSQLESGRCREARIQLAPVTEAALGVPNNRGGTARYTTFSQWLVSVPPEATRKEFKVSLAGFTCRLSVSPEQAGCIVAGVADLAVGRDDYCIGGGREDILWFWRFDSR